MSTYAAMQQRAELAGEVMGTAGSDQEVNANGVPTAGGEYIILATGEIRGGYGSVAGLTAQESFMKRMGMIVDPRSGAWISRAELAAQPDYTAINAKYNADQLAETSRWFQSQGGSAIDQYGQPIAGTQTNPGGNPIKTSATNPAPASTFVPPDILTIPKIADPAHARFLLNGVTTDGAGNVLNVNRDQEKTMTAPATGPANPYVTPSDAQVLPTSNTTATAVSIDWKKYLPIVLGLVLLIAIALALRSRSHAA